MNEAITEKYISSGEEIGNDMAKRKIWWKMNKRQKKGLSRVIALIGGILFVSSLILGWINPIYGIISPAFIGFIMLFVGLLINVANS